ncbi:MAG TPA: selenium cofactor biosynthesis protein YqeC [Syntrophorhabdaceae bacterium]|nr:selenium cofactor biosynthesis protein YqeC [Syntrophorhabdaceae bacterium]
MWHIQRTIDPSDLIEGVRFASFIGGGGKTTLIEHLARSCLERGKSVAIATTTKIFIAEPFALFDDWMKTPRGAPFMHIGKTIEGPKLTALSSQEVEVLGHDFDVVLIEADGAKGHPLKYPASYEPVIPSFSDRVFIVAGLDALFKPFGSAVFRHDLFSRETGTEPPRLVYPDIFIRFFQDDALLKSTAGFMRTIVLNKYDTSRPRHLAAVLMQKILDRTGIEQGVITAPEYGIYYRIR